MSGQQLHDRPAAPPPPTRPSAPPAPGDALAQYFLRRLARLTARQDAAVPQRVALARAAFAAYLDCRDLGLATDAAALLRREAAPAAVRPGGRPPLCWLLSSSVSVDLPCGALSAKK